MLLFSLWGNRCTLIWNTSRQLSRTNCLFHSSDSSSHAPLICRVMKYCWIQPRDELLPTFPARQLLQYFPGWIRGFLQKQPGDERRICGIKWSLEETFTLRRNAEEETDSADRGLKVSESRLGLSSCFCLCRTNWGRQWMTLHNTGCIWNKDTSSRAPLFKQNTSTLRDEKSMHSSQ